MNIAPTKGLIRVLDECADQLEYLNASYPHLASHNTQNAVNNWRQHKDEIRAQVIEVQRPKDINDIENFESVCAQLLVDHSLEDVSDILLEKYGVDISVKKLILTIGKDAYLRAMRNEASFLRQNGVANEQIADLWNELDRPGPNSQPWTPGNVTLLGS